MQCYNFSELKLKNKKADSAAIKTAGEAVKVYQLTDGQININTDDWKTGQYIVQFFNSDDVIAEQNLTVKQNLKHVSTNYDPRSNAQKILDAINAVLEGRATAECYHVKVGQKQITYMSFSQLMNFKNYYEKEVKKQQGKATQIRHQKLFYRGV